MRWFMPALPLTEERFRRSARPARSRCRGGPDTPPSPADRRRWPGCRRWDVPPRPPGPRRAPHPRRGICGQRRFGLGRAQRRRSDRAEGDAASVRAPVLASMMAVNCHAHHRDVANLRPAELVEGAGRLPGARGQVDGGQEFARSQGRAARTGEELGDGDAARTVRPEDLDHGFQAEERGRGVGGGAGVAASCRRPWRGCEADRRQPSCTPGRAGHSAAQPAGAAPPGSSCRPRR